MDTAQKFHHKLFSDLDDFRNDFRNLNLNRLVLSYLKGSTYLDIGCGSGFLLHEAKKRGFKVVGIEPNEELVRLSRKLFGKLDIRKTTIERLDSIGKTFDTISLIDVLEHIKDDRGALKKIHGRLAEGGRLVIVVPCYQFLYGKRDREGGHYRRYSRRELEGKLRDAGFTVEKMRYWNMLAFLPYLLSEKVLRRKLESELRTSSKKKSHERAMIRILHAWFESVENKFNAGFGISLICVARKR